MLQEVICVARGSEQALDERAQSCHDFCPFSSLAAWPGWTNPPVIAHCGSKPSPSPSSSPSTPRAENLGKAFPQTPFNLGLHTSRAEINPWKSWEKEGSENTASPQECLFQFFELQRKCIFPLLCPSHPSSVVLQPFSPCPDLGAGVLSAAPAFPLPVLPLSIIPCLK